MTGPARTSAFSLEPIAAERAEAFQPLVPSRHGRADLRMSCTERGDLVVAPHEERRRQRVRQGCGGRKGPYPFGSRRRPPGAGIDEVLSFYGEARSAQRDVLQRERV